MADGGELRILARFTIEPKNIDDVEKIYPQLMHSSKGSGVVTFDMSFSDDRTQLTVETRVTNSAALQELLMRIGPDLEALDGPAKLNALDCFGDFSDPVKQTLAPFGARFVAQ